MHACKQHQYKYAIYKSFNKLSKHDKNDYIMELNVE